MSGGGSEQHAQRIQLHDDNQSSALLARWCGARWRGVRGGVVCGAPCVVVQVIDDFCDLYFCPIMTDEEDESGAEMSDAA